MRSAAQRAFAWDDEGDEEQEAVTLALRDEYRRRGETVPVDRAMHARDRWAA